MKHAARVFALLQAASSLRALADALDQAIEWSCAIEAQPSLLDRTEAVHGQQ